MHKHKAHYLLQSIGRIMYSSCIWVCIVFALYITST